MFDFLFDMMAQFISGLRPSRGRLLTILVIGGFIATAVIVTLAATGKL